MHFLLNHSDNYTLASDLQLYTQHLKHKHCHMGLYTCCVCKLCLADNPGFEHIQVDIPHKDLRKIQANMNKLRYYTERLHHKDWEYTYLLVLELKIKECFIFIYDQSLYFN